MIPSPTPVFEVTTDDFSKMVVAAELPVVVDFWAPWCGPCLQLSGLLAELASEYQGCLLMVKVNVDQESALTASFGIKCLPTLLFYRMGAPREMITGVKSVMEIRAWINHHLAA